MRDHSTAAAVTAPATRHARCGALRAAGLLLGLIGVMGCMDPLVQDEGAPPDRSLILPPDALVPWVEEDPERAAALAEADGVDELIELRTAFSSGRTVHYWDFGPAPAAAIPVWVVGTLLDDGSFEPVGHPPVFDAIPGDPGYSPFWQMVMVPVTEAYDGELLPSFAAVVQAVEAGLVRTPVSTLRYINCPVVHRDVRLDMGAGQEPLEPSTGLYRGKQTAYFDLGPPLLPAEALDGYPVATAYRLRREGGEPLSEPRRRVDMTGDGDRVDTNDIFEVAPGDEGYTPLVQTVTVVVPTDYASIDTSGDDGQADYGAEADLFERPASGLRTPVEGHVVAFEATPELRNQPMLVVLPPDAEEER